MDTPYSHSLIEEKKTLVEELARLGRRNPENTEWEATAETADPSEFDPNSTADRFEDFEEKTALIVPLEARLTQVEKALGRIKDGSFGKCRVCNLPIEEARLKANTAADTCMKHLES